MYLLEPMAVFLREYEHAAANAEVHLRSRRLESVRLVGSPEFDLPFVAEPTDVGDRHTRVRACVSAVDSEGRTVWIADAHRDGKRYVVHADEKLTAFLELEAAIRAVSP
jgi:hypothetical protein